MQSQKKSFSSQEKFNFYSKIVDRTGKKESKNNGVFMKTYPGGWIKKIVERKL